MPDFSKQLSSYIPKEAAPIISRWIIDTKCRFTVSKRRKSKFGDYRSPHRSSGSVHRISVNNDLNPYAFLITLVHEFAHLRTWMEHKHLKKPHGIEWKTNFKNLMQPFIEMGIFPQHIQHALEVYMKNPSASSCSDLDLYRVLKSYDPEDLDRVTVETLVPGTKFSIEDGRVFILKEKRRTRYSCEEVSTGRIYLFHAIAEVSIIGG